MIKINNPKVLKDFNTIIAYRAQDLGLEQGEWDFVTCNGGLQLYEHYEEIAESSFDNIEPPIVLLGKEYKASDVAKEMDPASWQAFVELGIAHAIANGLIRRII